MPKGGDGESVQNRMQRWALEHPNEWDVVLGVADADAQELLPIIVMLKEAGFAELPELLAMRAYRLLSDSNSSGT